MGLENVRFDDPVPKNRVHEVQHESDAFIINNRRDPVSARWMSFNNGWAQPGVISSIGSVSKYTRLSTSVDPPGRGVVLLNAQPSSRPLKNNVHPTGGLDRSASIMVRKLGGSPTSKGGKTFSRTSHVMAATHNTTTAMLYQRLCMRFALISVGRDCPRRLSYHVERNRSSHGILWLFPDRAVRPVSPIRARSSRQPALQQNVFPRMMCVIERQIRRASSRPE